MGFLGRYLARILLLAPLAALAACGSGGDLTTVATGIVEVQRKNNVTLTALSGTWAGKMEVLSPEKQERTILLVFGGNTGIRIYGSLMIQQTIELDGSVRPDTFEVLNGLFENHSISFNLAYRPGGSLVLVQGSPLLFEGNLTENTYFTGSFKAGAHLSGQWDAALTQ